MSVQGTAQLNFLFIATEQFQLLVVGPQAIVLTTLLTQFVHKQGGLSCKYLQESDPKSWIKENISYVAPEQPLLTHETESPALGKKEEPQEVEESKSHPIAAPIKNLLADVTLEAIERAQAGIQRHAPERAEEGVNGAYFLKDVDGNNVAVFKPRDEGLSRQDESRMIPSSISITGAAEREAAAYLLDKEGFYGVPPTTLVSIDHPSIGTKEGSFQEFIPNDGASWDIGPSQFPVREVHKIGILDLHLYNCDRHGGNILYKEDDFSLVPIDNGFALPYPPAFNIWFEWMNWKQAKVPFDQETKNYIDRIDIESDMRLISSRFNIPTENLESMKISMTLLKKGASRNLTLFDVGSMLCRMRPDEPSMMETLYNTAKETAKGDPEIFFEVLFNLMDEEIEKRCK